MPLADRLQARSPHVQSNKKRGFSPFFVSGAASDRSHLIGLAILIVAVLAGATGGTHLSLQTVQITGRRR